MNLSIVSCVTGVVVMVGVTIVNFRCRIVMKVDLDVHTEKAEKRNQALELTYRFEQYIVAVKHDIESLKGTHTVGRESSECALSPPLPRWCGMLIKE